MLELLISSAILITVLAVMRFLFRGRIPPGLQYAVWLLVLLRLFLPFHLFPSPVSAAGAITHAIQTGQVDEAEQTVYQADAYVSVEADHPPAENLSFDHILRYGWLIGSVAAALWFGAANGKLAVRLRRTRRRLDYAAPVPIYIADGLSSPCLYGLFRPAVYLTEQAAHDPRRAHITITHELTHWRHRDHLWSAARVLCLIVYWYDPFVWLAAWLSKQDGELYCDDCAIRSLGEEQRYAYGRVLLELSEAAVRPSDLLCTASTISGGARRMRERIIVIAHKPKRSIPLSAAAVAIAFTAVICTFSSPSAALEARPMEITPTSPPLTVETPAPDEAMAALPPTPISVADEAETIPSAPVAAPVQTEPSEPADEANEASRSGSGYEAIMDNTSYENNPYAAEWQETGTAVSPTPTPAPVWQDSETTVFPTPTPVPQPQESGTAVLPTPTPVPEEAQQIVVRDMRDVYMNSDWDPYPDMPSTVPDSPPPAPIAEP